MPPGQDVADGLDIETCQLVVDGFRNNRLRNERFFFRLLNLFRTFAMSFRGSCPEPLFSDGEARSPIFFSSRSNGNIHR